MTPSSAWDLASSPFSSLIGTNHVPSPAELEKLRASLTVPQDERNHLRLEIARVRATLDGLLSDEKKMDTYIDAHQALMSPIRQIPQEVLAEIFIRCLPDSSPYGVRSLEYAPLLLFGVCKHWRNTALDTPLLWNSLHIHLPTHLSEDAASRRITGATLWLERSAALPLSISIHATPFQNISQDQWMVAGLTMPADPDAEARALLGAQRKKVLESLMKALLHFSDRFRDVYLCLSKDDLASFNSLSPPSFPALVSLKVADDQQYMVVVSYNLTSFNHNQPAQPAYAPLLDRMPLLKKLTINTTDRNVQYQSLPCNWASLTSIDLQADLTPVELLRLLTGTPLLQFLRVGVLLGSSLTPTQLPDDAMFPLATLSHLSTLRLAFMSQDSVPYPVLAGQGFAGQAFAVNLAPWQGGFPLPGGGEAGADNAPSAAFEARMSSIFSHIVCPSLKNLHVGQLSSSTGSGSVTFSKCPFLSLPIHALETLGINMLMTPEALMECLSLATSITSLDLVDEGDFSQPDADRIATTLQDVHLQRLTPSTENFDCLCPELKNFRMIDKGIDHDGMGSLRTTWSTAALTSFLEARTHAPASGNSPSRLSSCTIFLNIPRTFSDIELETLRALKKEGKLKLMIYQQKAYETPQPDDGAMAGLLPPTSAALSMMSSPFMPVQPGPRSCGELDDMDRMDTDVVV